MARHCKTCSYLRRLQDGQSARCGWSVEVQMPWPHKPRVTAPDTIIAPRHFIPGDHYVEVLGSTQDWTEVMDCQMWSAAHDPS